MDCDNKHREIVTAYHESAHAVVAYIMGARLRSVVLYGDEYQHGSFSWFGEFNADDSSVSAESIADVAVAGVLAGEVKTSFVYKEVSDNRDEALCNVRIRKDSASSITRALLARRDRACQDADMEATVSLELNERVYSFKAFFGEAAYDMDFAEKRPENGPEAIERSVPRVILLLDQPSVWKAVRAVGDKLMEAEITRREETEEERKDCVIRHKKELSGEAAQQLIGPLLDDKAFKGEL